jgi:hypothetical protein
MMSPTRTLAEPIDILSPSRPFSKSTVPAALEAPLEKSGQRSSDSVITFRAPQRLDLHVVPQHRLLRIMAQIRLLVHPVRRGVVVVANPSYKTGLKQQNALTMTAQTSIVHRSMISGST